MERFLSQAMQTGVKIIYDPIRAYRTGISNNCSQSRTKRFWKGGKQVRALVYNERCYSPNWNLVDNCIKLFPIFSVFKDIRRVFHQSFQATLCATAFKLYNGRKEDHSTFTFCCRAGRWKWCEVSQQVDQRDQRCLARSVSSVCFSASPVYVFVSGTSSGILSLSLKMVSVVPGTFNWLTGALEHAAMYLWSIAEA